MNPLSLWANRQNAGCEFLQENNQGKCRRYLGNSKLAGKICPDLLIYPTDFDETGAVGKLAPRAFKRVLFRQKRFGISKATDTFSRLIFQLLETVTNFPGCFSNFFLINCAKIRTPVRK